MTTTVECVVQDGSRQLRFSGALLGHASSSKDGKNRWSEIWIYRTGTGGYAVAGVGRSTLEGETDRFWAQMFDDADRVIRRLELKGAGGVRRLPFTSRECLLQACQRDRHLAEAYQS